MKSRNCCSCKLHAGTYTFIYSSSSNTYLIMFLLETCTFPLCFVLYYIPDYGCCRPKFIFHGKLDLIMCSVELRGEGWGILAMNNLILAKWRIRESVDYVGIAQMRNICNT